MYLAQYTGDYLKNKAIHNVHQQSLATVDPLIGLHTLAAAQRTIYW